MPASMALPELVQKAQARAREAGFELSCEPGVGALLATLAAAVPTGGRILELGTGVGVGVAWIVHGLGARSDVEVISVDLDARVQEIAAGAGWPGFVRFELGDGAECAARLGQFDLIFPDAPGGKLSGLRRTLDALRPGGILVVDDMDLDLHTNDELEAALVRVRRTLLDDPRLVVAELDCSSGIMVATRRR